MSQEADQKAESPTEQEQTEEEEPEVYFNDPEAEKAAIRIQASYRGYRTRKSFKAQEVILSIGFCLWLLAVHLCLDMSSCNYCSAAHLLCPASVDISLLLSLFVYDSSSLISDHFHIFTITL